VVAVGDGPEARGFLAWWRARLARHCELEVARGLHHDQGWVDLAPGFVQDCHLLRDPGVNVGHWNLDERALEETGGNVTRAAEKLGLSRKGLQLKIKELGLR
jgi:hypothetical protein